METKWLFPLLSSSFKQPECCWKGATSCQLGRETSSVYMQNRYSLCLLATTLPKILQHLLQGARVLHITVQVLHITEILAALSSLPATASSDICPLSKSLFCKQVVFIFTASVHRTRNHTQTTFFHHCNLPEQLLEPSTAQWTWWVRSAGSFHPGHVFSLQSWHTETNQSPTAARCLPCTALSDTGYSFPVLDCVSEWPGTRLSGDWAIPSPRSCYRFVNLAPA